MMQQLVSGMEEDDFRRQNSPVQKLRFIHSSSPSFPFPASSFLILLFHTPTQQYTMTHHVPIKAANDNLSVMFPRSVRKFAVGMLRTSKEEFSQKIDMGVPLIPTSAFDKDVLILYSKRSAMPNKYKDLKSEAPNDLLGFDEALENCNELHVVLNHRGGERDQCLAIVPQVRRGRI
jgi:hypothetical protein